MLLNDAYKAEVEKDWELARQLWIRVNIVARGSDLDAIEAFFRIKSQPPASIIPELVISRAGERTSISAPLVFQFEVVTVDDQGREVNREKGQAQYIANDLGNGISLEMVAIPGGKFLMGSPEGEGYDKEKPQHEVTIQPFFMGKYPVTQAQWRRVAALPKVSRDLKSKPSYFKGDDRPVEQIFVSWMKSLDRSNPSYFKGDDRPVEQISWYDAVEFCARLSRKTGRDYRLPSEAEWEYACRAGTITPFHFGDTITTDLANYNGNDTFGNGSKGKYRRETTPVGSFPPNTFGLNDMHGNVWEWCADTWHESYQGAPTNGSAWINDNDNQFRQMRGGS